MKNILTRLSIATSLIFLAACGGGGLPDVNIDGGGDTTTGLSIFGESSQSSNTGISPTGTWKTACYAAHDGNNTIVNHNLDVITFSSTDTLTIVGNIFQASDTTCSGAATSTAYVSNAAVTVDSEQIMLGWKDGDRADDVAPAKADGSGPLTAQPNASMLDLLQNGAITNASFYIDDSIASAHVLYLYDSQNTASNGFAQYFITADPYYKQ